VAVTEISTLITLLPLIASAVTLAGAAGALSCAQEVGQSHRHEDDALEFPVEREGLVDLEEAGVRLPHAGQKPDPFELT
jgi:hypothetical protein